MAIGPRGNDITHYARTLVVIGPCPIAIFDKFLPICLSRHTPRCTPLLCGSVIIAVKLGLAIGGVIFVNHATVVVGVKQTDASAETQVRKIVYGGQVFIIRGNQVFTVMGQKVK